MGFLDGVRAGNESRRVDRNDRVEGRRAKQQRLSNFIAGYEQDANGDYAPNERGQESLKGQFAALKQKTYVLETQNEMMQAQLNEGSMNTAIKSLAMGDAKDAWRVVSRNPVLKASLQKNFNMQSILPVDWENDASLFKDAGIDMSPEALADPKVRNAFNSSFFKVVHPDGTMSIGNTQDLINKTDFVNTASKEDSEGLRRRYNLVGEVLSGYVKSPQQREDELKAATLNRTNVDSSLDIATIKDDYIEEIKLMPISNVEKLNLIFGINGEKDPKALERKIKELKYEFDKETNKWKKRKIVANAKEAESNAWVAGQTENDKKKKIIANAKEAEVDADVKLGTKDNLILKADLANDKTKLEIKEKLQKIADGKPFVGEAKFRKDLGDMPFNDESLAKAAALQGKRKLGAEVNKNLSGRMHMAKGFNDFTERFRKAKLDHNAVATIGSFMDKITKPGMTTQDREMALNKVQLGSEAKALLAEYVKFMSGAAVTEGEYSRYQDIFTAGAWSSRESADEAMRSFTNYLRESAERVVDSIKYVPH